MKKKYKKRVDALTKKLSKACVEMSESLKDISLDGTVHVEFDFIEKDKAFYFDIRFVLPVMKIT